MNPWVIRIGDDYHLYYAGADRDGFRRICLATAPVADPETFTRRGPVLDVGAPGAFDARWVVLPHVVQIAPDRWHLYYTANSGVGEGLSAFPGLGLAVSSDGKTWEKHPDNPILAPTGRAGDPDRYGIAGGSVLQVRLPDGATEWRWYYTACPSLGSDLFLNQQKICCYAVSRDAIHWDRRGPVLFRNPDRDYENAAVAGPVVHQAEDGSFRMWYSAIGTRWGAYSIAYAESPDGIRWNRGEYGDNLQLAPAWNPWEWQMVEYPSVIREGARLRLFYCGNGYGSTGIGTALACPLRATACPTTRAARVVAENADAAWLLRLPATLNVHKSVFTPTDSRIPLWHGPAADGNLWQEAHFDARDGGGRQDLHLRTLLRHTDYGIEVRLTAVNLTDRTLHRLSAPLNLEGPRARSIQIPFGDLPAGETATVAARLEPDPVQPAAVSLAIAEPEVYNHATPWLNADPKRVR